MTLDGSITNACECRELAFRLGLYIVMAPLSGAASGLLASAILSLDQFGSTQRWQMIFAIEGVITIAFALIALLVMTDRPETVGGRHWNVSHLLTKTHRRVG